MRYHEGNVLDVEADAIIVTVDGTSARTMGNVANRLMMRMGNGWDEIEEQLEFPIPLGQVRVAIVTKEANEDADEPVKFKYVFFLSVLDHQNEVSPDQRPEVVRRALVHVLKEAARMGLKTVASPLLKCGWRVSESMAHQIMKSADELCAANGVTLIVHQLPRR